MSRALDAGTVATLHFGDNKAVYNDISKALCPNPPALLEFEFLGKSHPLTDGTNLLIDGSSIAIPKFKLVQAFIHARQLFFDHLMPCPPGRSNELLEATAVILLMDPEHLTAANSRKRFVQSHLQDSKEFREAVLKRELLFVDSYLTSRLHRHTKSPTLWSHRKWLLELCKATGLDLDLEKHLNQVVLVAAERHPRNYYAWLHLRWLVKTHYDGDNEYRKDTVLAIVQDWCLRHPADTSGFSFLLFYLDYLEEPEQIEDHDAKNATFQEVLDLTRSFHWEHESVWVFLRTLAASRSVDKQKQVDFLHLIDQRIGSQVEGVVSPKTVSTFRAASIWFLNHEMT